MSLHVLAHHMASKGRGGDSMLVHMTPGEVHALQKMAEKLGGTLTINPETGLPEASFLGNLFKAALPMIAGFALGPAGFGLMSALGAGATVGGITALATGSLSKGLMAGLGAYGGAGLGGSISDLGAADMASSTIQSQMPELAGQSAAQVSEYANQVNALRESALAGAKEAIPWTDKLSAGFNVATKDPAAMWDFAKANKAPLAAAGLSYMAGQEPAKLNIPTATQTPGMIRPMMSTTRRRDPNDPLYNPSGSVTGERNEFVTDYTVPEPYRAATGGIVALADGGMSDEQLSSIGTYLATNPSASDLSSAMQQFGVSQADVDRARSQMAPAQAPAANPFTVGSGPQVDSQQLATQNTQSMAQAGQGIQWGNGQSEAALIEQARSKGWDPQQMAQAMGVPVDAISGAINRYDTGIGRERELAERRAMGTDVSSSPWGGFNPATGGASANAPTPTAAPSPFTVGGAQAAAPSGIETLSAQSAGQDLSGTVAGAFVGPRNTVITYDSTGKQTDTGRPASALNEYLTGAQQSGAGSFLRNLSWGVSPEEDAKSVLKLKDYARANNLNEADLLRASGLESQSVTATGLKSQFDKDLSGTAAGAFVGPNGTVITFDQYGKQTDTGRPASALNDYLTGAQESNVGAFVRGLSWGVSPEEDAKSSKALYDYAKSRGLSASELIKQSGLEGTGVTAQGLQSQWAQWNVTPTKPIDPYNPGSPIIAPPPGRAPLPAPKVPVNAPKPPGWTGITGTPIPPKPTPTGGIPTLTTLSGDPYGLTPPAKTFTPPTRTGRSQEIYDYLMGKTSKGAAPTPAPSPAPSTGSTTAPVSSIPKASTPDQQPVINSIYKYIHSQNWGTPEADAVSAASLSDEATLRGWSMDQLATASGFSATALRDMFKKYGVALPTVAAATQPQQGGGAGGGEGGGGGTSGGGGGNDGGGGLSAANGGLMNYRRMAGGGLGSLGGYSDGGQLLRGPGDGVSDHIPATIGDRQPARLADGEFVVPARIVSELGNGSTEAGARSLYRMMDRVQAGRKKSIGKGKVAVDSRAENYLPA